MKTFEENPLDKMLRMIAANAKKQAMDEVLKHCSSVFNDALSLEVAASRGNGDHRAMEELVLTHLQGKEPQTMTQMSKSLGVETSEIAPAVRRLHRAEKLVKSGNSRGTRYSLKPQDAADTPAPQAA